MDIDYGMPFRGYKLENLKSFLSSLQLDYDNSISFTVNIIENNEIAATGSLDSNVLKCIAVSQSHQGEGLSATIITELRKEALRRNIKHLMLFTKPKNKRMFSELGFYPIAETKDSLIMENIKNGIMKFIDLLERPANIGTVGAIVANCNPFTLGHRYLIETAASQCDTLHVFILSEDKSMFSSKDRLELVKKGVSDLNNVFVHETGPYLISSATFPTYFIKNKDRIGSIKCELDIEIFANYFARPLNITKRFVGTEPLSVVTNEYNKALKAGLPPKGIEIIEIERIKIDNQAISASRVREEYLNGNFDNIMKLVPETTLNFLENIKNRR